MKSNIVLVGFMGVGKTPIGLKLAEKLKKMFIDTDKEIEAFLGMKISEVFAAHGEKYFRLKENEIIDRIAAYENCVISTGGGVVLDNKNIDKLKERGIIICLSASPEAIYERVRNDNKRPLLAGEDMYEKIKKILKEREEKYRCADYYVDTSIISIDEAVEDIISFIRNT